MKPKNGGGRREKATGHRALLSVTLTIHVKEPGPAGARNGGIVSVGVVKVNTNRGGACGTGFSWFSRDNHYTKKLIEITVVSLLPVGVAFGLCWLCDALGWFYFCVVPGLLISGLAAYVTSLACRLARQRRWRLQWYLGLSAVLAAAGLSAFCIWLFFRLQPGGWGKSDPIPFFLWICVSGIVFGVLPAELIVWHYRKIVREASPAGLQ